MILSFLFSSLTVFVSVSLDVKAYLMRVFGDFPPQGDFFSKCLSLPEQQQQKNFHRVQTRWWFQADDSEKRREVENVPE